MSPIVIFDHVGGCGETVARLAAEQLTTTAVIPTPDLDLAAYDPIILIVSNRGDEELPHVLEDWLHQLQTTCKSYYLCELWNNFGLPGYQGCAKIAHMILQRLGWQCCLSVSIDAMPALDQQALSDWLNQLGDAQPAGSVAVPVVEH